MATWDEQEKVGILPPSSGWDYDEELLDYDSDQDPETSAAVKYDGTGENTAWTNEIETI